MFADLARYMSGALAALLMMIPTVGFADMGLLMVTSDYCPFCQAWERDVGVVYDKSPYAPDLPLSRIDMGSAIPDGVVLDAPVVGTPTFIVLRDGREIDRQRGYDDAEMFWWWLSEHTAD